MGLCVGKVCSIAEVKALEGVNNGMQLGYGDREKGRRKDQAAGQVAGKSIENAGPGGVK